MSAEQAAALSAAELQRQEVIYELITTERQYVEGLTMLVTVSV